jgi:hypothetical protein
MSDLRVREAISWRVRLGASVSILLAAALPLAAQNCSGPFYQVHFENIEKTKKQAANFKPGARAFYVSDFNDNENIYLKAALSPARRKKWFGQMKGPAVAGCMGPKLDELAAIARTTLPSYRPTGFTIRNAAEEKLLLAGVNDIAKATVLGTGLADADWRIEKLSNGIPSARYKHGMIYARYPTSDDGFCRIVHVNIIQDYAGGGTYAASRARFIKTEPAGCPKDTGEALSRR